MKRGSKRLFFCLTLVLVLSLSIVSASWFGDLLGKIKGLPTGNVVSDTGLVAWYKFDGNAIDSSGNGKNGYAYGAVLTTGKDGSSNNAYNFDGNDYISTSVSIPSGGPATFSGWFKFDSTAKLDNRYMLLFDNIIYQHSANDYLYFYGTNDFFPWKPTVGQWYNIALTYNGDTLSSKLYINGVAYNPIDQAGSNVIQQYKGKIGSILTSPYESFKGSIDEVRIYNRVLTASEIQELAGLISPACTSSWGCSSWSDCIGGTQTRTCTGLDSCENLTGKPAESQSCPAIPLLYCGDGFCNASINETCGSCSVDCGGCSVVYVDGCSYLSNAVINKINELEKARLTDSSIYPIVKIEMQPLYENNYVVLLGGIFQVQDIYNQTTGSSSVTNDRIQLFDVIGKSYYNAVFTTEGSGTITINGKVYSITFTGSDDAGVAYINFPDVYTAGNNKMRFEGCSADTTCTDSGDCEGSDFCVAGTCFSNCTDSDSGKDIFVKGHTVGLDNGNGNFFMIDIYDQCDNSNSTILYEYSCHKTTLANVTGWYFGSNTFFCPYGCYDGACITEAESCQSLTNLMKSPTDLVIENMVLDLRYNDSWESSYDGAKSYYAEWRYQSDYEGGYVWMDYSDLTNSGEVEKRLDDALSYGLCEQQKVYFKDDSEQVVYLCKNIWRLAYNSKEISKNYNNYENDVVVLWTNNDKLVSMEISSNNYDNCNSYEDCMYQEQERHRRQQGDLIEAVGKLIDNQAEYLGGFYLGYPEEYFAKHFLNMCGSQIVEQEDYVGSWYCKKEPVICPPHGEQTETCTRWSSVIGKEEVREATTDCSPGICSGCYVPKWFGDIGGNNKCIPYGFRFEQQDGWNWDLTEMEDTDDLSVATAQKEGDLDLQVLDDNTATLWVEDWGNQTYALTEGEKITIDVGEWEDDFESLVMYVDKIVYDSENYEDSYIVVTFHGQVYGKVADTFNAYCEIDGNIYPQKTVDSQGDWANCQNNYECDSNLCSGGECIEIQNLLNQGGAVKSLAYRILCRLANLFNEEEYGQCIYNFLG